MYRIAMFINVLPSFHLVTSINDAADLEKSVYFREWLTDWKIVLEEFDFENV